MALTSSPERPQPLRTVVAATKDWVERLGGVWVEGQLIEIKRRASATQFLVLRDRVAEVSVTLSTTAAELDAAGPLAEGTVVVCQVRPTVWTKSGSLTFECRDIRPAGEGRLLAQLEQRKRALQAEGLFNPALKKRLPVLPRRIGLITAENSAAERDVLTNVQRRWSAAEIDVRYATMQGPNCVPQVVAALRALDVEPLVDVIVISRGGGSLEDLLPFSDETLVRAVYACRTPVVTAIGHETDTPIIDLVADLRASTPTDAAKRIVPDAAAERDALRRALERATRAVVRKIGIEQARLNDLRSRPVLRDPASSLSGHAEVLALLVARERRAMASRLREESSSIGHLISRARAMSPQATLQRGYAVLSDASGATVSSITQVTVGARVRARLNDGTLDLDVSAKETP
ncbi:MAG TPA: exodeoxyribonuclease VII large subunit [Propionibacteriaceae bacterium]|nr:exodeoxyribonuclease VII large subunit [Micropruina sp.]HBX82492.1 exodeoxyribonuclease VII large subunit [Propionibacteriaceae bacterium]HBY24635.1 exodeoxyribonuclease VII large subunit [Propionibacteriaceae bacterium]